MRILDQSVESRAETIVTEKSALFNVKKVVKSVARTAVGYVQFVYPSMIIRWHETIDFILFFYYYEIHLNHSMSSDFFKFSSFFSYFSFFSLFFPSLFQWCKDCWKRSLWWSKRSRTGYCECWQRNKEHCPGWIQ